MYTGLSNGGRIIDGRMMVRSVSVHSSANAASGTRTDLWIQALPRLYCITPTTCIDIDFGARPYFFYYSLCINYLLCNNFFIITIISGLHYFLCTGKWSSQTISFGVTSAGRGASSTLHYPMPGTSASPCRPALTVLCHHFGVPSSLLRHLGTGSGMEPCPASSSDRVINTEHINQLSCLHAQSFKFLTCVRLDEALYFFGKMLLVNFFSCPNFVCDT